MEPAIAIRADAMAERGHVAEAVALLRQAAQRGDGEAMLALAGWLLEGRFVRRDLAGARNLFGRAAQTGHADGAKVYAAFLANGTGGGRDWRQALAVLKSLARVDDSARDQLAIVGAMGLDPAGEPSGTPQPERISASPDVVRFPDFLTPEECDFLVACAEPMMAPAMVVDPRTGTLISNPVRMSDGASFPLALENPAIHAINRRLAAASGTDVRAGEPLQILSYRPGQQYRAHHDALATLDNQRVLTLLVYLTEDYAGGETRFLPDGPSIRGKRGEAILFRNVDAGGKPDPAARHAGMPVTSGRKLIASRWIRERAIDLGDRPR